MNAPLAAVLADLHAGLAALYGPRLERVVLFGSQARGDATPESDVDVMIVLSGPLDPWQEVQRTSALTSDLSIRYDTDISRVFATPEQYAGAEGGFYDSVRREGVAAAWKRDSGAIERGYPVRAIANEIAAPVDCRSLTRR